MIPVAYIFAGEWVGSPNSVTGDVSHIGDMPGYLFRAENELEPQRNEQHLPGGVQRRASGVGWRK